MPAASSSRGGMQQASLNHTLIAGGSSSGSPLNPHLSTSEEEQHARALLELSIALVESALDILSATASSSSAITDAQLTQPSELMPGGTIGKHFRHVIETFQAFLLPLVARPPGVGHAVVMNYDAILPASRKPLARNVAACRKALAKIRDDLRTWGQRAGATVAAEKTGAAGVSGEVGTRGLAGEMRREVKLVAITPTRQEMRSSVGRELWFCSLHAIHHFSMLRTIAVHEMGLDLPVEFGTAPSTLLYWGKDWRPTKESRQSQRVKSKL